MRLEKPPERRPAGPRCKGSCRYTSSLLQLRAAVRDAGTFRALWAESCDHTRDAYMRLQGKVPDWQRPTDLGA